MPWQAASTCSATHSGLLPARDPVHAASAPRWMNDRVVVPIDRVTVFIAGAIELPGEYELLRGATVADLVNQAGGPTPYANRRRIMVRQPDISGEYVSMPVTFEEGMLVMLRDNAVVRVLSSYGSGSAIVVEGAVYGKPIDGEGPITLPTALPTAASELRAGLPAPVPVRLVLPFFPGMTAYDALYAVGGPTPFARAEDSYVVRAGERIELDAAALWDGNTLTGDIWMPMSKSTSRSGQWKCPSRSSITLKTWSTEACRNHGNRSWSRYNSVSRHASHRPTGVSCTTSTREVLTPCTYYLLLSPLDDSLDRSRLVGADAFRHCGFDCRVEPEFRLAACADDVYVDSRFFPRKEEEPIRPLPEHGRAHVCEYSDLGSQTVGHSASGRPSRRRNGRRENLGLVGEAKAGDHRGLDALAGGQHLLRHPQRLAAGA